MTVWFNLVSCHTGSGSHNISTVHVLIYCSSTFGLESAAHTTSLSMSTVLYSRVKPGYSASGRLTSPKFFLLQNTRTYNWGLTVSQTTTRLIKNSVCCRNNYPIAYGE